MNIDDQIRKAGLEPSKWNTRPGGRIGVPRQLKESKSGLEKIKEMLERQVEEDHRVLAMAMEELSRLKHGGAAPTRR